MSHIEDFIWVVTSDQETSQEYESPKRGIREISEKVISKGIKVPAELLKSNFQNFFRSVIGLIDEIPEGDLPYVVDEIEIQVVVDENLRNIGPSLDKIFEVFVNGFKEKFGNSVSVTCHEVKEVNKNEPRILSRINPSEIKITGYI